MINSHCQPGLPAQAGSRITQPPMGLLSHCYTGRQGRGGMHTYFHITVVATVASSSEERHCTTPST